MGGSDGRTLVLVGKTGNGKSATGNSILGKKRFQSKRSLSGVTSTSEMETEVLEDGQMLTIIDTPGLFDASVDHEIIAKEIVSCIKMAVDGIHALLLVFTVRSRFSEEEKSAISSLQLLFGEKICDYMIVGFTGADELEEEDGKNTLEGFLSDCPESLKEILSLCGNRCVLFDNKTNDETKKANQVRQLLSCVNMVLDKNGGPFTNEIFTELKKWGKEVEDQKRDEQLTKIFEMVELKLMNMKLTFDQKLSEELHARTRLEEEARIARKKAEDDINRLRAKLRESKRKEEETKRRMKEI